MLSTPALLSSAGRAFAQGNDIPVGLLFSLTGAVAVVESTLHDAALMAIEEINASGGFMVVSCGRSSRIRHPIRQPMPTARGAS